jgi:hypothetical protein
MTNQTADLANLDMIIGTVTMQGKEVDYIRYGDGEYYCDALDFATSSETSRMAVYQLEDWVHELATMGYTVITPD